MSKDVRKDSTKGIAAAVLWMEKQQLWHKRWRNLALLLLAISILSMIFSPSQPISNPHIAMINIDEVITKDSYFWDQFERVNTDTKAVLILMNSPGGAVGDSERLYNQIRKLQRILPVSLLVENYATSGGYLGALGADNIYAYNSALIGSIGVVMQNYILKDLYEKVGVEVESITTGQYKGYPSSHAAMPAKVKQHYQRLLDSDNEWFLSVVIDRRGLTKEQVNAIKDAQVYSAKDALEIGLIDAIATRDDMIELLREEVGYLPVKDMSVDEEDVLGLSKIFKHQRRSMSNVLHTFIRTSLVN